MKKIGLLVAVLALLVVGVTASAQVDPGQASTYDCDTVIEFRPLLLCER